MIDDIELDIIRITGRYFFSDVKQPKEFSVDSSALSDETLRMIFDDLERICHD